MFERFEFNGKRISKKQAKQVFEKAMLGSEAGFNEGVTQAKAGLNYNNPYSAMHQTAKYNAFLDGYTSIKSIDTDDDDDNDTDTRYDDFMIR